MAKNKTYRLILNDVFKIIVDILLLMDYLREGYYYII